MTGHVEETNEMENSLLILDEEVADEVLGFI